MSLPRPRAAHVHTVTGSLPVSGLGRCYAHAHLLGGPVEHPPTDLVGLDLHLDDKVAALEELKQLRTAGAASVVEMSCLDFRRDLAALRQLSEQTGVTIVATTGFRTGATAAASGMLRDREELAEVLVRDVVEGEGGVTCGVLKAGSGLGGLTEEDRTILWAAALAHRATGAPISTHTSQGELAVAQLEILEKAGVDLSRVAIGHFDRERDREMQLRVLERGVFVIYDQIGKEKYGGVDYYVDLLTWVEAAGFGGQVLLSSDLGRRSYLKAFGGTPGLSYLVGDFALELVRRDVSKDLLERAMVENSARLFTCTGSWCESAVTRTGGQ